MRSIISNIDKILRPAEYERRANETQKAAEQACQKRQDEHEAKEALATALTEWLASPLGKFVRNHIELDKKEAVEQMICDDEGKRVQGRTKYLVVEAVENYLATIIRDYKKSQIENQMR